MFPANIERNIIISYLKLQVIPCLMSFAGMPPMSVFGWPCFFCNDSSFCNDTPFGNSDIFANKNMGCYPNVWANQNWQDFACFLAVNISWMSIVIVYFIIPAKQNIIRYGYSPGTSQNRVFIDRKIISNFKNSSTINSQCVATSDKSCSSKNNL